MIVVHGETLWSPAPQPMDDDDDDDDDDGEQNFNSEVNRTFSRKWLHFICKKLKNKVA